VTWQRCLRHGAQTAESRTRVPGTSTWTSSVMPSPGGAAVCPSRYSSTGTALPCSTQHGL